MTSPAPSPHPTPENPSAGHTDGSNHTAGWRIWAIEGRQLLAPFTRTPLPTDGHLTHPCDHRAPLGCEWCGISYFTNPADAARATQLLDDPALAITAGTLTGRTWRDPRQPLYTVEGWLFTRNVVLPTGRRTDQYQITTIYTDLATNLTRYGVPVHPLADLAP